ncbi:unnamed protein product [Larinioides sclopetarius]|uniref:Uncharacterized protein n=1 Tax=Larinioides sclopetarius TaxID=280406 RepID=A0AAV2BKW5_9ARAC
MAVEATDVVLTAQILNSLPTISLIALPYWQSFSEFILIARNNSSILQRLLMWLELSWILLDIFNPDALLDKTTTTTTRKLILTHNIFLKISPPVIS